MSRENNASYLLQACWNKLSDAIKYMEELRGELESCERELEGALFLLYGPDALPDLAKSGDQDAANDESDHLATGTAS